MKKGIQMLLFDIKNRGWRGLAVVALVMILVGTVALSDMPGVARYVNEVAAFVLLGSVGAIAWVIKTDSQRSMHISKGSVYFTIIAATLWAMTFVYACFQTQQPLFEAHVGRDEHGDVMGAYLTMSPIVMMTALALIMIASGAIAYKIGQDRKDVKGIKKEHIFR